MEVILREDVEKLGSRGDLVKVASGYARNFLLPQRKAVAATDSNRKIVEQERQSHLRKEAKQKGEAEELAKLVGAVTITIARKAGEEDHLFGSVTAADIADALTLQHYNVERRRIQLDEPIRTLGEHKVTVRLHREVTADVTVNVVRAFSNLKMSLNDEGNRRD
jgi:large subunit ribosomal protein L9